MGKRAEQKENRRQEILMCSLDLFVHRGYHGTTTRDIAKLSGISVGLLFHYFPTKQAVLEELVLLAQSGINSALELMNQPVSPIERLEQITALVFDSFRESPSSASIFMLANQALTSHWVPETIKKELPSSDSMARTALVIIEGQREGSIKEGDPHSLALAFWGAIQGVAEGLVCYPHIQAPEAGWIVDILRR